jgi:hypothetical protein
MYALAVKISKSEKSSPLAPQVKGKYVELHTQETEIPSEEIDPTNPFAVHFVNPYSYHYTCNYFITTYCIYQ